MFKSEYTGKLFHRAILLFVRCIVALNTQFAREYIYPIKKFNVTQATKIQ